MRNVSRVLLIALLLGACSSEAETSEQRYAIGVLSGGPEFADFRESYDIRLHDLTSLCMIRQGFPAWGKANLPILTEPSDTTDEGRYFNIVDGLEAATQSLETVPDGQPDNSTSTEQAPSESYLRAEREALNGTSSTVGCEQEARVIADEEFRIDELEELAVNALDSILEENPEARYDEEEWLRCRRPRHR